MKHGASKTLGACALALACSQSSREVGQGEGSGGTAGGAPIGGTEGDANGGTSSASGGAAENGGTSPGAAGADENGASGVKSGGFAGGTAGGTAGDGGTSAASGVAGTSGNDATGGFGQSGTDAAGGASGNAAGTAGANDGGNSGAGSGGTTSDPGGGELTMGWIGCSMGSNVAEGYARIGGTRMWGAGQNQSAPSFVHLTQRTASAWYAFDQSVEQYGAPTALWIQICAFVEQPTLEDVVTVVGIAREHVAPGTTIYITGQPLYVEGHVCPLLGQGGAELTDRLAREVAGEPSLGLIYPGAFGPLDVEQLSADSCHANIMGGDMLGEQARRFWG
jgi:hypothetical protein